LQILAWRVKSSAVYWLINCYWHFEGLLCRHLQGQETIESLDLPNNGRTSVNVFNCRQGVTSQNTWIFINIMLRTSNQENKYNLLSRNQIHPFMVEMVCFCSLKYIIYLLTAIGLPPGSSTTKHIYSQTIHKTTQNKQYINQHKNFGRV